MGRELRWHLARAGREKLKGLGKTRAPSADRGNPGPLESQLSGRDSICAKTFKTSCAPAIWSARSPSQGWSNGWFPTGFKLKRWSWRREVKSRVPISRSSSFIDSARSLAGNGDKATFRVSALSAYLGVPVAIGPWHLVSAR
jgi:hypothetical protein